ncbi:MAG: hypothetical protein SFW62_05085 [Alphaproteobacteria bacterium]|nr:hypothetical protein [Alphaproteobacteria bacterium]
MFKRFVVLAVLLAGFMPHAALACACGCGVFEAGTGSLFPTSEGGTVWLEYDYMNQNQKITGGDGHNHDEKIRTDFVTAGGQYMFNRSWGINVQVPVWNRYLDTIDHDDGLLSFEHADLGDIRLRGIYTGFFDDMSTGVTFGLKLPTGDFNYPNFERDTQIGTGSTDILLGAYHRRNLTDDAMYDWFINGQWQHAISIQDDFRPGDEFNIGTGVSYNGLSFGSAGTLSPIVQAVLSHKLENTGANAHSENSGYTNLMVGPGLEYNINNVRLYGDILFPVMQNVNGTQLVAPLMFKFIMAYNF